MKLAYDEAGRRSGDAEGEVCHHEDLLTLMDALGVERAALAGCSMGGAYAVEAALAAPGRVAALALIGSGLAGHRWPPASGCTPRCPARPNASSPLRPPGGSGRSPCPHS